MYVQVVTYALGGMGEDDYLDVANELAPRFSGLPGLQAKIWLEDPDLGRYGAVYFWEDQESMERFLRSELFEGTNPEFVDVDSEGFGILENLTAQTQPGLEVVAPRRRPAAARPAPKALTKKATPRAVTAKAETSGKATAKKAPATKATAKKATKKSAG